MIWSSVNDISSVYVGGYKSALNKDFLVSSNIRLIVNTCPGLERIFGAKFKEQLRKRREDKDLSGTKEIIIEWVDSTEQILDPKIIFEVLDDIDGILNTGGRAINQTNYVKFII